MPSVSSRGLSRTSACPEPSVRTTVCHFPAPTPCMDYPASRSGGCASGSISNASQSPEQNGRHERMHLTLKKEATKPAAENFLAQQARFDDFIEYYNRTATPGAEHARYPRNSSEKSPGPYKGLKDLEYPFHDRAALVTNVAAASLQTAQSTSHRFAPLPLSPLSSGFLTSVLSTPGPIDPCRGRVTWDRHPRPAPRVWSAAPAPLSSVAPGFALYPSPRAKTRSTNVFLGL